MTRKPISYSRQDIDEADIEAVSSVLRSDFLTQGPAVARFEQDIADIHRSAHSIAVCNATAALHIGCLALGVGPGDTVWTTPISFVASANCALYCGARIDFVDIDPATRNMSIDALRRKLEEAAQAGCLPKVIIPVDFSGLPCDLQEIRELADRYKFAVLEDASHAVGARYRGEPIGANALADITVFSFHPVKIVTTGEGGVCLTNNAELADRLRLLRSHGITRDPSSMVSGSHEPWYYEQIHLGFNYRMTDIQAALGSSQLRRLHEMRKRREALADRYDSLLADLPVTRPPRLSDRQSAHHLYVIELEGDEGGVLRSAVYAGMRSWDILTNVHYIPIHLQPFFREIGFREGQFPAAERYFQRALTLPLYPSMSADDQDRVVAALREYLR